MLRYADMLRQLSAEAVADAQHLRDLALTADFRHAMSLHDDADALFLFSERMKAKAFVLEALVVILIALTFTVVMTAVLL